MKPSDAPKGPLYTQGNLGLKAFQKLAWRLSQKKQCGVGSLGGVGKHETNKKVFVWNIEIGS